MAGDRLSMLLEFYEQDPDDAFTRFALAHEYAKAGKTDEALRFFEALVEDQPGYTGTYYHLGKLYVQAGRIEDALATYTRGIEVARQQRALKDLSELQDALLQAQGVGFDEDDA